MHEERNVILLIETLYLYDFSLFLQYFIPKKAFGLFLRYFNGKEPFVGGNLAEADYPPPLLFFPWAAYWVEYRGGGSAIKLPGDFTRSPSSAVFLRDCIRIITFSFLTMPSYTGSRSLLYERPSLTK